VFTYDDVSSYLRTSNDALKFARKYRASHLNRTKTEWDALSRKTYRRRTRRIVFNRGPSIRQTAVQNAIQWTGRGRSRWSAAVRGVPVCYTRRDRRCTGRFVYRASRTRYGRACMTDARGRVIASIIERILYTGVCENVL